MIRTRRSIFRINICELTHILVCHPAMRPVCAAAKLRACRDSLGQQSFNPGQTRPNLLPTRLGSIRGHSPSISASPEPPARDVAFSKHCLTLGKRIANIPSFSCANSKWDSHFDFAAMLAHTHTAEAPRHQGNAASGSERAPGRLACWAGSTNVSPTPPGRYGNDAPAGQGSNERRQRVPFHKRRKDQPEAEQADAPERRPCGIERRRLLTPPSSVKAGVALVPFLVLFDQRGTCAEDRRKCQKETAD
jgi:hypothetical protein